MKKKMLVVDDIEVNRAVIISNFSDEYDIIEAKDGISGLQVLTDNAIDIVVLDLMMPRMNGIEMLKHMKNIQAMSLIPVIVITAVDDVEKEIEVLDLGADDIIRRPFDIRVLKRRIQNIIKIKSTSYIESIKSQLQSVLDNSIGSIMKIKLSEEKDNPMFEIIYANKEFYRIRDIEYLKSGLNDINISKLMIIKEDYSYIKRVIHNAIKKNDKRIEYSYRIMTLKNTLHYIDAKAGVISDNGNIYLDVIENDVTESRLLRNKLNVLEGKYKSRQKNLDIILDYIPGGVGIYEVSSKKNIKILYANKALCDILQYTKQEYGQEQISGLEALGIHPDDVEEVEEAILGSIISNEDIVARLGGDEFCVYIERHLEDDIVIKRVSHIGTSLNLVFKEDGKQVEISSSIGVAFSPENGTNYTNLYESADHAQYNAKKHGKNRFSIYGEKNPRNWS